MKLLHKFVIHITTFFLVACNAKNTTGYEKIEAVVTGNNGNLYILTETLDYELPKSKIKDAKLFFELAPIFSEINQPISARMWVKERSIHFAFDEAVLRIYKEENHKFALNNSMNIKDYYATNIKAKKFLKYIQTLAKKDKNNKLSITRENNQENVIDYTLKTNKKMKNDQIRGHIVNITNRQEIIKAYQLDSNNFKDYRVNIFYEPSLFKNGFFTKNIDKESMVSGNQLNLEGWKTLPALKLK
ncbi:hypothetical protein [Pasteurella sp. PK-2025]|uniref:hypothetical protein n=1 Tax=unclassified Pasteurella TaxID=2621516 RepID=UPI003C776693